MLSFVYRLVDDYEQEHGSRPNTLYLSQEHLQHLISCFSREMRMEDIVAYLDMEIMLDESALHPRVGWMNRVYSRAV